MEKCINKNKLRYPIAVCVGPIRSGTTWIYELLKNHPQCITTDPKETSFFCINYNKGIDWFLSKFQASNKNTKLCADISPLYFLYHDELYRVKEFTDEVKIIICLRNPYERLRSIYNKLNATGKKREILEYIDDEDIRTREVLGYNLIHHKAKFLIELFGKENVYFFDFDELKSNSDGAARKLLQFLGLDYFISDSVGHEVNPTYEPRSEFLQFTARKISAFLRKLNLYKVVDFVKFSIGNKLVYGSNPSRPSLDEAEMETLFDYFKDDFNTDISKLERLTGIELGHWKRP
jgi:hypothetical protein